MNKKRIIGEGVAVETCGGASLAGMARETHGRASLRAMPAGKGRGGAFLRAMPAGKGRGGAFLRAMPAGKACGGMFLLVGLALLFAACEKDTLEGAGDGKKVEILLSTNITNYQTGGDMVRSNGVREPISTMIPLNGEFHLRATLVPDSEGELRDSEEFMDGQKLCFAAFKPDGSGQVGATAIYTYSTAKGEWSSSAPLMVVPDNATEYRFVAYSYFESTATPSETGIDPAYDLVWGKSENKMIVGEAVEERTVSIHMTHKFARVKVRVRSTKIATATITALSGVEVAGGKLATLNPFDGDIALGNAATQGVTISSSPGVDDISSSYRTVTPVGSGTVSVKLGTVGVSTAPSTIFSNKWASFDGTLDEAKSYMLVVDLKQGIGFAYSNIYWDGGKLTFDTADKGHQGYQGLYFKWGSLVGVSPVGGWVNNETPVYRAGESASTTYSSWGSIPYDQVNSGPVSNPNTNTYKGDVCRYIHAGYRMPVKGDFGVSSEWNQQGWEIYGSTAFSAVTSDKEDGTYDFIDKSASCAKNTVMGGVILPASGLRNYNSGALEYVGSSGCCWNGIAEDMSNGHRFGFNSSGVTSFGSARGYGFSVRCVQN